MFSKIIGLPGKFMFSFTEYVNSVLIILIELISPTERFKLEPSGYNI